MYNDINGKWYTVGGHTTNYKMSLRLVSKQCNYANNVVWSANKAQYAGLTLSGGVKTYTLVCKASVNGLNTYYTMNTMKGGSNVHYSNGNHHVSGTKYGWGADSKNYVLAASHVNPVLTSTNLVLTSTNLVLTSTNLVPTGYVTHYRTDTLYRTYDVYQTYTTYDKNTSVAGRTYYTTLFKQE